MRRRRRLVALAAVVLALSPLLSHPADAAKRVTVTGRLTWPDGTPAARQHIELTRVTGLGDAFASLLFFGLTAGLASVLCFDEQASEALVQCGKNTIATRTGADGRYVFELSADVLDSPDRRFRVTARVPRSAAKAAGAQVEVTTRLRVGRNALPSLRFWQPRVTGPVQSLSWTPLAAVPPQSYGTAFVSRTGLRHDAGGEPPLALDARLLEDTRGTLTLTARGGTSEQPVVWTAPPTGYVGTAGAPASRRARCSVTVELVTGTRTAPGCWLTDARFDRGFRGARPQRCFLDPDFTDPVFGERRRYCEYANVTSAVVDLGRVVEVDAVIARGECSSCEVETSVDRLVWERPDQGTGPGFLIDWEGRPARWVRVMADQERSAVNRMLHEVPNAKLGGRRLPAEAPGDLSGITELSVWQAVPVPTPVPSPAGPPDDAPAPDAADEPGDRAASPAVVLALLLLLGTAAGLGLSGLWRRRTQT